MSTSEHAHAMSGTADGTPWYVLALSILLASLVLSASIYFSADLMAKSLDAKSLSINVPPAVINVSSPPITINTPSGGGSAAAAAPSPSPAPAAAAGCGIPSGGSGAVGSVKASVDVSGRPVKGAENAKVTIVEFGEYQCPYCVRANPTMQQLLKEYDGKVNLVFMNYIVHPTATTSSVAAECANDQGKYFLMHDQIFSTQKTDAASLRTMAQGLGMDMAKYDACMAAGKDALLSAQKAAGSAIGVGGTPSFVIGVRSGGKVNGQMIVGAQDISMFRQAIDAQLKN